MNRRVAFWLCLVLLFVWSIPGTIALRSLLMAGTLLALVTAFRPRIGRNALRDAGMPTWLITLLTLWLVVQAMAVSRETSWALGELRGQWLPALIAFAIGLLLVRSAGSDSSRLPTAFVLVLGAQAALAVGHSLWHWVEHGELLRQLVPLTGGKLEMSFVLNLLLAFLTVDLFCRATGRPPLLRLRLPHVLAILVVALGCGYLAGARNGILGILFLSLSTVSLYVFDQRRRLGLARSLVAAAAVVLTLGAFALASVRADPRWQTFAETAALAWDIDRHTSWLDQANRPWPKLADGRDVEYSAYTRIAFIHGGFRLIAENPLGTGYGRNAFAHALRQQHPEARLGHAHSGWIDLGIGGGWPALALWAALLASLIGIGWQAFFRRARAPGLVLFFLSTGYAGRMVLDSVNKDHMLQMFMFLAGALLMLSRDRATAKSP
jgi:hypothetical protein